MIVVCSLKIMQLLISSCILIFFDKKLACEIKRKIDNKSHLCEYDLLRNAVYSKINSFRESWSMNVIVLTSLHVVLSCSLKELKLFLYT